jgi:hypothetical protein
VNLSLTFFHELLGTFLSLSSGLLFAHRSILFTLRTLSEIFPIHHSPGEKFAEKSGQFLHIVWCLYLLEQYTADSWQIVLFGIQSAGAAAGNQLDICVIVGTTVVLLRGSTRALRGLSRAIAGYRQC